MGLLLSLLSADLSRAPLHPIPDARLLRACRAVDARQLAAVRRLARRQTHCCLARGDRPTAAQRLRPLLGCCRTRAAPALRSVLLPTASVVHRERLRALRGRRTGRAQDGARPVAGAYRVGPLARAPAVLAGGGRLSRARGSRRGRLPR